MTKKRDTQREFIDGLLGSLRTPQGEIDRLRALEKSGKAGEFDRARIALDKAQELRGMKGPEGVDPAKINPGAFRLATAEDQAARERIRSAGIGASLIAELLASEKIKCDCLTPFRFNGLWAYGAMGGPSLSDVRNGVLGAIRLTDTEYTVANPGNTQGKTRVPLNGRLHLDFAATVPAGGQHCLLLPSGLLWVHGRTRVVGHGNSTTSYDAKVWVRYFLVLAVGNTLLEMSGGQIHHDGTRSEDRTKFFNHDVMLGPRYAFFNANAGDLLTLSLRLEVDTESNEDGIAFGIVDAFGFPANRKDDYDTFLIKTG